MCHWVMSRGTAPLFSHCPYSPPGTPTTFHHKARCAVRDLPLGNVPIDCATFLPLPLFPSGNANGVLPQSPGLRHRGATPGNDPIAHQRQRRCAEASNVRVPPFRGGCYTATTSWRSPFCGIRARATNMPGGCNGTTPSGLFRYRPFTHGSTSAVQPWALWQNPVGIPGRKMETR